MSEKLSQFEIEKMRIFREVYVSVAGANDCKTDDVANKWASRSVDNFVKKFYHLDKKEKGLKA